MKNNGLEPNVQTFNMILFSSFEVKELQMVRQLLKDMIDSRIKLSDRNFFNLRKFQCNWNLLTDMGDLGLLSSKALHAESVKANYKHCAEVDTQSNYKSCWSACVFIETVNCPFRAGLWKQGRDIKVLKAEHVSSEIQIEFAQEVDIMSMLHSLNYYFSLKKYRSFASNWSILARTSLCFFQERNRRFSRKGIWKSPTRAVNEDVSSDVLYVEQDYTKGVELY
ncbi:hypothetical protein MTR_4g007150 [Medicago truncatula]|uniref:Uncharacterized protein n=1 Tax=Medicago truncatula TaxID=3880 RepID=G7JEG2_MEDTR|nr:hypothetical protein MTR_4g007150 [Medicago truncatula]